MYQWYLLSLIYPKDCLAQKNFTTVLKSISSLLCVQQQKKDKVREKVLGKMIFRLKKGI